MARGNPARSGSPVNSAFQAAVVSQDSKDRRRDVPGKEFWQYEYDGGDYFSDPVVARGKVFVTIRSCAGKTKYGAIVAHDAETGDWCWSCRDPILDLPYRLAVADSVIYISGAHETMAVNADTGAVLWRVDDKGFGLDRQLAVSGVFVYVADENTVCALDRDTGARKWSFGKNREMYESSPSMIAEDTCEFLSRNSAYALGSSIGYDFSVASRNICVFLSGSAIYGINAFNGLIEWQIDMDICPGSQHLCDGGTIYFADGANKVLAIDSSNGNILWSLDGIHGCWPSLSMSDGVLCVSMKIGKGDKIEVQDLADGRICAIDVARGAILWQLELPAWLLHWRFPIISEQIVYLGYSFSGIFACDLYDGTSGWAFHGEMIAFENTPAIVDGVIYFSDSSYGLSAVMALNCPTPPPAEPLEDLFAAGYLDDRNLVLVP